MKVAVFKQPGTVTAEERPMPTIEKPTDALIRIVRASVTTYDKEVLLQAVLDGTIASGKVFTKRFDLAHSQDAYEAMDQRTAIKSLLVVSD